MMARAAEASGLGALMAGAGTTTPSSLQIELIDKLKPGMLTGMSSYALHLAEPGGPERHRARARFGQSGHLLGRAAPAAKREKLGRMWGAEVRNSFGMTEAGMMAAEDSVADGFRVWSDLFFVEVVDPTSRQALPDGETGALVVTPLFTNNITPFLRWMSGDLVTLRRDVPGAGPFAVFPVLRHAQRTTGFFKIRGININHCEFEDLMFRLAPINDFKCEALTLDALDVLRVCVEIKRDADPAAAVALVEREISVYLN